MSTGAKEYESSAAHILAAGYLCVTARSHLAHVLKQTVNTEYANTGAPPVFPYLKKKIIIPLYFWISGFKTVVIVIRRKLRAICVKLN
jgi:hypothetical protein